MQSVAQHPISAQRLADLQIEPVAFREIVETGTIQPTARRHGRVGMRLAVHGERDDHLSAHASIVAGRVTWHSGQRRDLPISVRAVRFAKG